MESPPELQQVLERLAVLEELVASLQATIAERDRTIVELRARLDQDSSNSNRPPSSDPPGSGASEKRKKARSRRRKKAPGKPGGQPGHKGSTRELLPVEAVDHIEPCRPAACSGCGASLAGAPTVGDPERHQVSEIPPIKPVVTEYQLHRCSCPGCGVESKARLPEGISGSAFGPRVHALVASMSGVYHVSRRLTQSLLENLFGLNISLGAISNMEARVTRAVNPIIDEVAEWIRATEQTTGMDETGWRQAGERRWLWVALTELVTLFAIRTSRGGKVVAEMIGTESSDRIVVVDRWSAYSKVPLERRQFCWAHLIRDFQKMADASDETPAHVGRRLGWLAKQMFRWLAQLRAGTLPLKRFRELIALLRSVINKELDRGAACDHKKTAGTCRQLRKQEVAMWTFTTVEGVEPTNNASERALRAAVIWRKICLGTQSLRGNRFVEAMLTISTSLKSQHRNIFEFLGAGVKAAFSSADAPSLLPADDVGT